MYSTQLMPPCQARPQREHRKSFHDVSQHLVTWTEHFEVFWVTKSSLSKKILTFQERRPWCASYKQREQLKPCREQQATVVYDFTALQHGEESWEAADSTVGTRESGKALGDHWNLRHAKSEEIYFWVFSVFRKYCFHGFMAFFDIQQSSSIVLAAGSIEPSRLQNLADELAGHSNGFTESFCRRCMCRAFQRNLG